MVARSSTLVLVGLVAFVAVAGVAEAQYQYHFFSSSWRLGGSYQWANLTWSGNSGGIVWDGTESPQDNAPPDPHTADDYKNANTVRSAGLDTGPRPRTFEFVSQPAPRMMVLNVSRPIQVEFVLKVEDGTRPCQSYASDPKSEIRLYMGDKLLAGFNGAPYLYQYFYWYYVLGPPNFQAPPDPPGYTTCRFSLGAEATVIPEGAILKLEVTWLQQARTYAFGLAGEHRSHLRFPVYPTEEVVFRYPELTSEDDPESLGPEVTGTGPAVAVQAKSDGLATLAPAVPLLISGLAAVAKPRRRGASLLVLLLVTVALGGCVASRSGPAASEESLRGSVENTFIKSDLQVGGSILGQVYDDLHVPVGGVHVSILGSSEFTQTDGKGRFQFPGLLPAVYKLRFDKKEYKSFEAEIEVKAGFVSRPGIMMYLLNPKERDLRAHSHDYWPSGATQKELMNVRLPTSCSGSDCHIPYDFRVPAKGDDVNAILPGTIEVEVTLDWDPAVIRQEELGLAVQHNGDKFMTLVNWSVYAPRARGVPFRIATNWEMTDAGHQTVSTWAFRWFEPFPNYYGNHVCTPVVAYACISRPTLDGAGTPWINAKIVVKRGGALPLEPGHPDHWAAGSPLDVIKATPISHTLYSSVPPSLKQCTGTLVDAYVRSCPQIYFSKIGVPKLVPDGTQWMEVTVKMGRAAKVDWAPVLYYKPTNIPSNPNYYSVEGWKSVAPTGGTWEKYTYKIPVKAIETDFMYAKASRWEVTFRPDNWDNYWLDMTGDGSVCVVAACVGTGVAPLPRQTITVDAKVYNTPM